jgi:hypothetical protein
LIISCTIFPHFDAFYREAYKTTVFPEVGLLVEGWLVQVAGSIPDGVMENFHYLIPPMYKRRNNINTVTKQYIHEI